MKAELPIDLDYLESLNQLGGPKYPNGNGSIQQKARAVKRGDDFLAEYEPLVYTIDGILPAGSIYGLTGKRGTGKTAFLQSTALSVITGRREIMGFDVELGRVAYVILENPDDFRAKLSVNVYVHGIENSSLRNNLAILDAKLPHAEMLQQLADDAEENGLFGLVCYDTFQAGFSGAQFNDNKEVLSHVQALRELTTLPGKPSVLVACHPIKNATRDNLEPYGGGATMNELDGNLTLWNEDGRIELGWNKVRGPDPEAQFFLIEKLGAPHILDNKGRTPLLPVMRPTSIEDAEQRKENENELDRRLLKAMIANPDGTQADWAKEIDRSKGRVNARLQKLKQNKLVEESLGKWRVTAKGMKEADVIK
jgi:hypothetical protein